MEAIIKTNDKKAFDSLIQILKNLSFDVEVTNNNKSAMEYHETMTIDEYNNKLNEAEVAYKSGKTLTHNELKNEVIEWKNGRLILPHIQSCGR